MEQATVCVEVWEMTEEIEFTEEVVANGRKPMFDMVRKVLLAGMGAVALAQDEAEDFVNRLIERGEIAEKDGRGLVNELIERRKKKAEELREGTEEQIEHRIERILARMNIPTKSSVAELDRKITSLSRKIDELKKAQATPK
jgi:poly(hydroxyalkanoate) granule-associated protein